MFNILDTEYWCISFDSRLDLSRTGDSWPQDGHKAKFVKLFMYEVGFDCSLLTVTGLMRLSEQYIT